MATWMDRSTADLHARWAARASPGSARRRSPTTPHVFANLGDGTYFHSGLLAIRAAVAAERQHHLQDPLQRRGRDDRRPAGRRPAHRAADRAPARRRGRRADRRRHRRAARSYARSPTCRRACTVRHRDELDAVQRELRETAGRHGADLRPDLRRREAPPPQARHVPRPGRSASSSTSWSARAAATAACKSNCVSVDAARDRVRPQARDRPVLLQQGLLLRQGLLPELRHRRGRQAAQGQGAGRRRRRLPAAARARAARRSTEPYGILVTGIGGTGVVTIGALLGMAAHLEGKGVTVLDMTGPRAEGRRGAVARAHRRRARGSSTRARIAAGEADAVIGCDIVVTAGAEALAKMQRGPHARGRQQRTQSPTAEFTRNRDLAVPAAPTMQAARSPTRSAPRPRRVRRRHAARDRAAGRRDRHQHVHARLRLAAAAWCRSRRAAIERAIELNGVAVEAEPAGLPLGPPRRARPRARSSGSRRRATRCPIDAAARATLDEIDRAPRRAS